MGNGHESDFTPLPASQGKNVHNRVGISPSVRSLSAHAELECARYADLRACPTSVSDWRASPNNMRVFS